MERADEDVRGCGRRAPQGELVRFGAVDGELVPGRGVPGRGAYTCRTAGVLRARSSAARDSRGCCGRPSGSIRHSHVFTLRSRMANGGNQIVRSARAAAAAPAIAGAAS